MGILSNLFLAQSSLLPALGSVAVGDVNLIFQFILWVALFFFVMIVGLLVVFILRYRYREGVEPAAVTSGDARFGYMWILIPGVLLMIIFYLGLKIHLSSEMPPRGAYEVRVIGQNWNWNFTYENGYSDSTLHVPVDRPVKLLMRSEDVIYSLFVPTLRLKKDLIPGRETETWFMATESGVHPVYCAERCGVGHADMVTTLVVHEPGGFDEWMRIAANLYADMEPAEAGQLIYATKGCTACHSVDGSRLVGPSFKGVFGRSEALRDGSVIRADESYLRESILDPTAKVVEGFEPTMPPYKGLLTDDELGYLVEFIKSLAE